MRRGPPVCHLINHIGINKSANSMTARSQITGVKDRDPTCAKMK